MDCCYHIFYCIYITSSTSDGGVTTTTSTCSCSCCFDYLRMKHKHLTEKKDKKYIIFNQPY